MLKKAWDIFLIIVWGIGGLLIGIGWGIAFGLVILLMYLFTHNLFNLPVVWEICKLAIVLYVGIGFIKNIRIIIKNRQSKRSSHK